MLRAIREENDLGAVAKILPDLGDQFALSITGSQFDCPFGVQGSPVSGVGVIRAFGLQAKDRLLHFIQKIVLPGKQSFPKVGLLAFIQEEFPVGRLVLSCVSEALDVSKGMLPRFVQSARTRVWIGPRHSRAPFRLSLPLGVTCGI
jgi:hypothetical protein